jgi:hypothetical protein
MVGQDVAVAHLAHSVTARGMSAFHRLVVMRHPHC